jgi:release factor glutamine methyltransferase
MKVLEAIKKSSDFLANKGVDSPRLQVELMLAHLLKIPRLRLYLDFERELSAPEIEGLRALVVRRGKREPLQHILGTTSFCGLEIQVDRDVLIPRPETELLAEQAWDFLKAREGPSALDFGTGSGCIAIALALHAPKAAVMALDISEPAIQTARDNAGRNKATVQFFLGDGFAALPLTQTFGLIVSNPPYIPSPEIATLAPEVRDYDPIRALDGGDDGLSFYRMFAREARAYLKPGGALMLEFGDGQAEAIRLLFAAPAWQIEKVEKDYSGRERILIARRNES